MRNMILTAVFAFAMTACAGQRSTLNTIGTALLVTGVVSGTANIAAAGAAGVTDDHVHRSNVNKAPYIVWGASSAALVAAGAVLIFVLDDEPAPPPTPPQ